MKKNTTETKLAAIQRHELLSRETSHLWSKNVISIIKVIKQNNAGPLKGTTEVQKSQHHQAKLAVPLLPATSCRSK